MPSVLTACEAGLVLPVHSAKAENESGEVLVEMRLELLVSGSRAHASALPQ